MNSDHDTDGEGLTPARKSLLSLGTLTTIGFGDRQREDRDYLIACGYIEGVGNNAYRTTDAGLAACKD